MIKFCMWIVMFLLYRMHQIFFMNTPTLMLLKAHGMQNIDCFIIKEM